MGDFEEFSGISGDLRTSILAAGWLAHWDQEVSTTNSPFVVETY